ncbi:MAG: hypothetical protein QGH70_14365, partial [Nitrospinota bacterium]|nr:hypothetical protein [Nitrospinota bacterium]
FWGSGWDGFRKNLQETSFAHGPVDSGRSLKTVMVYGPRDKAEPDVIMRILSASYRFALGN